MRVSITVCLVLLMLGTGCAHGPFCRSGPNEALDLDGHSGYAIVKANTTLNLSRYTLELWVYHRELKDWSGFVVKGHDPAENYEILTYGDGMVHCPALWEEGYRTATNTRPHAVVTGKWQHLAVTYDGHKQIIYVDGESDANRWIMGGDKIGAAPRVNDGPLTIGCEQMYRDDFGRVLNGMIDEVRIWDYARSSDQIKQNFNRVLSKSEKGLVAYYRFDGLNANGEVTDLSGNHNDARLIGTAKLVPAHAPVQ